MIVVYILIGAILGLGLGLFIYRGYKNYVIRRARMEAVEIVEEAQGLLEEVEIAYREKVTELEDKMWGQIEKDMLKTEDRIEDLEGEVETRKTRLTNVEEESKKLILARQTDMKEKERKLQSANDRFRNKQKQK
ncbi:MAG: hypothetical protein V4736_03290, partial [Bdellovibrionota bacterium]